MSQENVEIVGEHFAATNEGDFPRGMAQYAEDVELVVHEGLEAGRFEGREEVGHWFGEWFRSFQRGYHFELEAITDLGDAVFVVASHRAGGSRRAEHGVPQRFISRHPGLTAVPLLKYARPLPLQSTGETFMRKLIVSGVLAALGVAMLAVPASASFDHHFTVLSKTTSSHRSGNTFHFKDKLLDPRNRDNRVGGDRGRCTFRSRQEKVVCHAVARLNGEIGGNGHIDVSGDLGRHDHRLNVTGGTGDFDGVAGKLLIHSVNRRTDRLHFDLTR
jgi:ketosteroid isomerase-like protein